MLESFATRRPTAIRTADVLACFGQEPVSLQTVAEELGVHRPALSGHIGHLQKQGKITRIRRGVYVLSAWGQKSQERDA